MPNKQNLRVVECKPQPCVVSVEGLSSSTTDVQLKNLLMSVGPIQVGCLGPCAKTVPSGLTVPLCCSLYGKVVRSRRKTRILLTVHT